MNEIDKPRCGALLIPGDMQKAVTEIEAAILGRTLATGGYLPPHPRKIEGARNDPKMMQKALAIRAYGLCRAIAKQVAKDLAKGDEPLVLKQREIDQMTMRYAALLTQIIDGATTMSPNDFELAEAWNQCQS